MMNILELLKNEKVEWKKLGEVSLVGTGKSNTNEQVENGLYPFYVRSKFVKRINKYEFDEEAIIIPGEGGIGEIFHYVKGKYALHQRAYRIKLQDDIVAKYVYYYMKTKFKEFIVKNMVGSTVTSIRKPMIENFEIPIPSLEIQEKIVEILDKFTSYVMELQSELQSRTKQYTYYRDKLLSEEYLTKVTKEMEGDRKVKTLRLKEVCEFKRGKRLVKSELQEDGEFPVYQNSIIPLGYYHEKNFERDNTFIISAGAAGEIVYSDREFWAADDVYVLKTKENITSKYLYYLLLSKQYIIKSKVRKASIPRLSKDDIEKILVDIPPLSLQNKIVKVLDKFQVLLADTKGLLPEEIEQRQKQYEYYREKLLTFDVECSSTHARTSIISNNYYNILQEAANIVEVDIEDKIELEKLLNITKKVDNINWKVTDKELRYIDLSSVNTGNKRIEATELITKANAPSRAKQIVKSKDIIFGTTRPMQERLALIPDYLDNQVCSTGYCVLRSDKEIVKEKWIYYNLLKTDFYKYVELNQKGASYPAISDSEIKNYKIPIPPLHVQQHVVSILDKFDTLVNDIKEGLPKEIEQRQKQYEYWRECLLNFPR